MTRHLVCLWPNGPRQWLRLDGTVEEIDRARVGLSLFEAECTRLRYERMLPPAAIARLTDRTCAAVNAALNRSRAKAGVRGLSFQQVREQLTEPPTERRRRGARRS